uniref:Uncharacterized protein n=1 Tax=Triticum urartu TaxID=4572 RepID=A0A8R7QVN6_TRIUA
MPSPTPAAAASGEEDLLPECSHRLTPLPMPTPPPLENTMELEGLQPWKKTRPSWSTACCLSRLPLTSPSRQCMQPSLRPTTKWPALIIRINLCEVVLFVAG